MPCEASHVAKDPIKASDSANHELAQWRSRTMAERIAAVDMLRRQWLAAHDPGALDRPMEKVWRIVKRGDGDGPQQPNPLKAMP